MALSLLMLTAASFGVVARSHKSVRPLSIPPSTYWDGDDGWWSTFHVQVGTPGQTVRLLPGTSASAGNTIWVVIDEGCTVANPNLTNCDNERGYLFHRNHSTSWSTERLAGGGLYSLTTFEEGYLGLTGNAYYGFDTVNLGLPGSGLPTVNNQVIAGFGTNDFWLGSLGLSPIPFNFTDLNDPQPSLLATLFNQSLIPSLSWGYTAGAHYKDPPVLGSLTLGGYDTSRFQSSNVSVFFDADFSRDLLIELKSVACDIFGTWPLLTTEIDVFLDSMVTDMYLPLDACRAFEQAFNLTWDNTTELYIIDEAVHNALLEQNPTFTFTMSNGTHPFDIVFPYAAFDLNITQPLVGSDARYFPLKQTHNSSQWTLGRVFFQEAYVIADYTRGTFSVSQALFPGTNVPENLVSIHPPDRGKDKGLSSGAIAGIVVAIVASLALFAGAVVWKKRRTKRTRALENETSQIDEKSASTPQQTPELDDRETTVRELDNLGTMKPELEANDGSSSRHELADPPKVHELGRGAFPVHEIGGNPFPVHEIGGDSFPAHELGGGTFPVFELEASTRR